MRWDGYWPLFTIFNYLSSHLTTVSKGKHRGTLRTLLVQASALPALPVHCEPRSLRRRFALTTVSKGKHRGTLRTLLVQG